MAVRAEQSHQRWRRDVIFLENGNKIPPMRRIWKRYLKCLEHIKRKAGLENVTLTRYTESERDRGKQLIIYLTWLCKWLAKQGLENIPVRGIPSLNRVSKIRRAYAPLSDFTIGEPCAVVRFLSAEGVKPVEFYPWMLAQYWERIRN